LRAPVDIHRKPGYEPEFELFLDPQSKRSQLKIALGLLLKRNSGGAFARTSFHLDATSEWTHGRPAPSDIKEFSGALIFINPISIR